ncbi:MAG: FAD-dependent oxidoreductase [Anaerococcus sp.]|nr:FAD-dependent oxidoreductase [Anaerococcus sp.]
MNYKLGHKSEKLPKFFEGEQIGEIKDTKDYDLVIIGAGTPGVPAAIRANERGLKVCVIQKEEQASACGNIGAGILLDKSKKEDIEKVISQEVEDNNYRSKRSLYRHWAYNSGEAISWLIDIAKKAGCKVLDAGDNPHKALNKKLGTDLHFVTSLFGPKPYSVTDAIVELAEYAENQGVDFYYNTRAVDLVKENDKVRGVIAKNKDSYIQFNGKYGVIVGTGDYQNDDQMLAYYLPDVVNFKKKKSGREGDGQKMIVRAGGVMENIGHTKMCHDFDSGPSSMMSMPYLRVKKNGRRFTDETVPMEYMNCFLLSKEDQGEYMQIFDSAYIEKGQGKIGGSPVELEELNKFIKDADVSDRTGVIENLIDTQRADSLEELGEKLGINDIDTFVETVNNYNKMAEDGEDKEFGVDKDQMISVKKAPFYGIHRHIKLTLTCSGVNIDDKHRCLDINNQPIEGLYAIGNVAGNMYGAADYPLGVVGLNLANNYTSGYTTANYLADLKDNN